MVGIALLVWVSAFPLFSQSRGAILDPELYNSLPQKAVQLSRSYTAIPPAVSLKQYAPYPGDQNPYGTCVAWASAYAARTIAESIALNRRDRFLTTNSVFSPAFVYKSISTDVSCQQGTAIPWALDLMQDQGAVKMLNLEKSMDFKNILLSIFSNSRKYPIAGYTTLYVSPRGKTGEDPARTPRVKKSLAEHKPVIIAINCPDSFFTAQEVWHPSESPQENYGGHALCVIGYDDTRYGGAFEIQNSWGEQWGNAGYIWIPYDVFDRFAIEAYEIIEQLTTYKDAVHYAGFAEIERYGSDEGMPVSFHQGYYQTTLSYPSGTEFRFLIGNDAPAYVYAFAADAVSPDTTRIFPPEGSTISPVLDYGKNVIAFPGEFSWIQMDQQPGTDYLVILYAKEALDIDALRRRFEGEQGSFPERVAKAVGPDFIPYQRAHYEPATLRFTAQSTNTKAVFGLLLAIDHHRSL